MGSLYATGTSPIIKPVQLCWTSSKTVTILLFCCTHWVWLHSVFQCVVAQGHLYSLRNSMSLLPLQAGDTQSNFLKLYWNAHINEQCGSGTSPLVFDNTILSGGFG